MDYESASPGHPTAYTHAHVAGGRRLHAVAALEEQLLSYSENAENEGEEEEYLEEEVLQVHAALCDITQLDRTTVKCCDFTSLSLCGRETLSSSCRDLTS